MKRTFTKEYILSNRGCYEREDVESLSFINNKRITLKTLFDNLPIKDFTWFFVHKCDLTLSQKRLFALHCAKQVESIYNDKCHNDNRVNECNKATELYINGEITLSELGERRDAAYTATADADVYAPDAAAASAYASAYAASYAASDASASASAYASYAASDAADAADAADASAYKESIWYFLKTI